LLTIISRRYLLDCGPNCMVGLDGQGNQTRSKETIICFLSKQKMLTIRQVYLCNSKLQKRCLTTDLLEFETIWLTVVSAGCPSSFRTISKLRRHEKTHKNERQHVCEVCSKAYLRTGNPKENCFFLSPLLLYSSNGTPSLKAFQPAEEVCILSAQN